MTGEKITLRLKSDHAVVLPEATLRRDAPNFYEVRWGDATENTFPKRSWEPVPPPYVLPTGIGAVIKSENGRIWIRVKQDMWRSMADILPYSDGAILTGKGLVTLSEGVEL